jgi:hypothetical protein
MAAQTTADQTTTMAVDDSKVSFLQLERHLQDTDFDLQAVVQDPADDKARLMTVLEAAIEGIAR